MLSKADSPASWHCSRCVHAHHCRQMKADHTLDDFVHIQGKQLLLSSFALGLCGRISSAPAQAATLQILAAAFAGQVPAGLAGQAPQGL